LNAVCTQADCAAIDHVQAAFLDALPRILNVANFRFRHIPCPDSRADCVSETVALCWMWYVRLVRKGRNPVAFMTALARYGATAVACWRRTCGQEKVTDVLSRRCQWQRGIAVSALPSCGGAEGNEISDALRDNTQTPVIDQVQFRCDFPAWKDRLPVKLSRLVELLALGHRTKDLAAEFGLSEARISQLRRELYADYVAFCGGVTTD
jgi:hypothetical protein